jgi:hypothetical protein
MVNPRNINMYLSVHTCRINIELNEQTTETIFHIDAIKKANSTSLSQSLMYLDLNKGNLLLSTHKMVAK